MALAKTCVLATMGVALLGSAQATEGGPVTDSTFVFHVGAGFADASSTEGSGGVGPGNNVHGTHSDPIFLGSVGVTILPKTYNVTVSIGGAISSNTVVDSSAGGINRGAYTNDVDYFAISFRPSFAETPFGSFGLLYEKYADNKNLSRDGNSGAPSAPVPVLDLPNDGKNPAAFTGATNMVLAQDDSLGFKGDHVRIGATYNLPGAWDLLGVEYALESGHRQFYLYNDQAATSSTAVVTRGKYTGNRVAMGVMRDKAKVDSGFSVTKAQVFRTTINAKYYDYRAGQQAEIDGVNALGLAVEFNYKTKFGKYILDLSLAAEKQVENHPGRSSTTTTCNFCSSGDIKRTTSYGALLANLSF